MYLDWIQRQIWKQFKVKKQKYFIFALLVNKKWLANYKRDVHTIYKLGGHWAVWEFAHLGSFLETRV